MYFSDMRDFVYSTISDNSTSQHFISTGQMEGFANKALREIVEATGHIDGQYEWVIGTGIAYIVTGDVASRISRVEIDGVACRPTVTIDLSKYNHEWRDEDGQPRYYYLDGIDQQDANGTTIGIYPKTNTTYPFLITYIANPADVVLLEDMDIQEWAAYTVAWSMLADCYMADTEIQNVEVSKFYRFLFKNAVSRLRARSFDRLPKAWTWQTGPTNGYRLTIWNNVPSEIPQP